MIGQFDFSQKGWVSGKGRSAVWRPLPFDRKKIEPQYLIDMDDWQEWGKGVHGDKIAFMDVTASTNTRTMIASPICSFPFGHSAPVLSVGRDLFNVLALTGILNSFVFDFIARPRVSGIHFTLFILEECRIPPIGDVAGNPSSMRLIHNAARLSYLHRLFAPQWLCLKHRCDVLSERQWKEWWAVTESDRLRCRVELDALCADLYSVDPEEYEWIVRDDQTDSKGFYRVDSGLPYEERLTGLSARAFRTLTEGKWSSETAAKLSNDEFFEILGIPELTNAEVARVKGLPGPLILKRDGCQSWHPENCAEDDPQYGWTWDDCRKDAIALLGSEEVLEEYIAKATSDGSDDEEEEPFRLISEPAEKKNPQKRLF